MNGDDKFHYAYTALNEKERKEIEGIKNQYVSEPEQSDKLGRLRRLNDLVKKPPKVIALIIGVVGVLVLGAGMAASIEWHMMFWGVIVGILGMGITAAAYPVYKALLNRNKRKYGRQIIELSNELLNLQEHEEN